MKSWLRKKPLSSSTCHSSYGLLMPWFSNKPGQNVEKKRSSQDRHCEPKTSTSSRRETASQNLKQAKVRVCPREACKIKALENKKKCHGSSSSNNNNNNKTTTTKGMESLAVVKHSHDPQQDFRDSMVDMMVEMRLRKPEEMEELLACYLTLNDDHYHGLIVSVFKQVWTELDAIMPYGNT